MVQTFISPENHRLLSQLAAEAGRSVDDIIAAALEVYRRGRLLDEINAGYAALRADPDAWAAERADRTAWDVTLADGLAPGER